MRVLCGSGCSQEMEKGLSSAWEVEGEMWPWCPLNKHPRHISKASCLVATGLPGFCSYKSQCPRPSPGSARSGLERTLVGLKTSSSEPEALPSPQLNGQSRGGLTRGPQHWGPQGEISSGAPVISAPPSAWPLLAHLQEPPPPGSFPDCRPVRLPVQDLLTLGRCFQSSNYICDSPPSPSTARLAPWPSGSRRAGDSAVQPAAVLRHPLQGWVCGKDACKVNK